VLRFLFPVNTMASFNPRNMGAKARSGRPLAAFGGPFGTVGSGRWRAEPKSATDEDRALAVIDDVIGDAAKKETPHAIKRAGPDDHHVRAFGLCR
jgi:hypothetical protein